MKTIVNAKGAFDLRPAEKPDLPYILSSWQNTWLQSPEWDQPGVIRDEYFHHAHLILDEIIYRSSEQGALYICHHAGQPHLIRGYLCGEVYKRPEIAYLHWVQVKKDEWNRGVGSALMEAFMTDFRIEGDQNILYTFSSKAMTLRKLGKTLQERYNLVYWPTFKYTSQEYGWEAG